MKVKRSSHLAVFGNRTFDPIYAITPVMATAAREYAEMAVNNGGDVDMLKLDSELSASNG